MVEGAMSRIDRRTRHAVLRAVSAVRSVTWRGVRAVHTVPHQLWIEQLTARVFGAKKIKKNFNFFTELPSR